jgi:hypothetical protein
MPGILLAVRVFCSWHTGNSLPVPGNIRLIPVVAAGLVSEASLKARGRRRIRA